MKHSNKEAIRLLKLCFPKSMIIDRNSKTEEDSVIEIDGCLFVRQEESKFQFDTLNGPITEKRTTFTVDKLIRYLGNNDTPPEDDYITIGDRLSLKDACKMVGTLLADYAVDHVFEWEEMNEDK